MKIKRPTQKQYRAAAIDQAFLHSPVITPCAICGWPVVDGYPCFNSKEPSHRKSAEETAWAKRFKSECPESYGVAIEMLPNINYVTLSKRALTGTNDSIWAIIPECNTSFWLDITNTKKAAIEVCREMGWHISR